MSDRTSASSGPSSATADAGRSTETRRRVLKDVLYFFKGHWPHVVIAIPGAVAFTALHELAHCVAVWLQGGFVDEFKWLPSRTEWGHMRYLFPPGVTHSTAAVSLSPYAAWVLLCLLAGLLSLRRNKWPFWFASTVLVWLFIVPLADIANAVVPYLFMDANSDFRDALGPARPQFVVAAGIFGLAAASYGYSLNRRLYRDRAAGFPAYCVLAATALVAVVAIGSV